MRIIIAAIAIITNATKLCAGLIKALYKQQVVSVYSQTFVGLNQKRYTVKTFKAANKPLADVDTWFHYLKGNINLVGPKALLEGEAIKLNKADADRFKVAPGLITPYQVKKHSGIAHVNERQISADFGRSGSTSRAVQMVMATVIQSLMGNTKKTLSVPNQISLFGVEISNDSMSQAIDAVMHRVRNRRVDGAASHFAYVNADCVNQYVEQSDYKAALQSCERVFADGIGIRMAARRHDARLQDNVNGTDLFPLLCDKLASEGKRVFLYGGRPEVVANVAEKISSEYPGLTVAGFRDGYTNSENPDAVCQEINEARADIVFVALGAPRQEKWISENKHRLSANVAMGVGGLFDFVSGAVSRAPEWMRELSLEWVWRLMVQPTDKAKRYLVGNPLFLFRVYRSSAVSSSTQGTLEVQ